LWHGSSCMALAEHDKTFGEICDSVCTWCGGGRVYIYIYI